MYPGPITRTIRRFHMNSPDLFDEDNNMAEVIQNDTKYHIEKFMFSDENSLQKHTEIRSTPPNLSSENNPDLMESTNSFYTHFSSELLIGENRFPIGCLEDDYERICVSSNNFTIRVNEGQFSPNIFEIMNSPKRSQDVFQHDHRSFSADITNALVCDQNRTELSAILTDENFIGCVNECQTSESTSPQDQNQRFFYQDNNSKVAAEENIHECNPVTEELDKNLSQSIYKTSTSTIFEIGSLSSQHGKPVAHEGCTLVVNGNGNVHENDERLTENTKIFYETGLNNSPELFAIDEYAAHEHNSNIWIEKEMSLFSMSLGVEQSLPHHSNISTFNAEVSDNREMHENTQGLSENSQELFEAEYWNENSVLQVNILKNIEELILKLLQSLVDGSPMAISIRNVNDASNCELRGGVLTLQSVENASFRTVSFGNRKSKRTFSILLYLLGEIFENLSRGITCTLRELYYRDPELVENERNLVAAVEDLCIFFNVPPWQLSIFSSSKGLIAGPLLIKTSNGDIIDCNSTSSGILLPHETTRIQAVSSLAEFVLVVEKDTVYERLLQDGFLAIVKRGILVTGKGFPDINTRFILRKISTELKIPIYALVDADPFGIDIFLVYRYGSRRMSHNVHNLACPQIKWLGVRPSEIESLAIPTIPFNRADRKRIKDLTQRSYIEEHLKEEILLMEKSERKAEIEAVSKIGKNYLVNEYIKNKLALNGIVI